MLTNPARISPIFPTLMVNMRSGRKLNYDPWASSNTKVALWYFSQYRFITSGASDCYWFGLGTCSLVSCTHGIRYLKNSCSKSWLSDRPMRESTPIRLPENWAGVFSQRLKFTTVSHPIPYYLCRDPTPFFRTARFCYPDISWAPLSLEERKKKKRGKKKKKRARISV
jgi:hypothetical protein